MSYPKRRPRRWDGDAVRMVVQADDARGLFGAMMKQGYPALPIEVVFCGQGADRCARRVLGTIVGRDVDAVVLPHFEAAKMPDGTWELRGPWPAGRVKIPLPATVRCPECGTRRRVKAERSR